MNTRVLHHEWRKALRSPFLYISLIIALALALAAALESYAFLKHENDLQVSYGYQLGLHAHNYLGQTRESSFGNWVVVSANAPLSASVFFYALPLLVTLPYAWSYLSEKLSDYTSQVCVRTNCRNYLYTKIIVVFGTGFLVTAVALTANFLVVSCLFPAYQPLIEEANFVGLFDISLFSQIFYSHPLLYVIVYTCLDATLMGLWAAAVTGLSAFLTDRIKLIVVPYLFLYAWHYFNGWIFTVLNVQGFNMNLFNSLRAESLLSVPNLAATLGEEVLLALIAAIGTYILIRKEEEAC